MNKKYFEYWGKTKQNEKQFGSDYHLLPYHCLDVAAVGSQLLHPENPLTKSLAEFLSINPKKLQTLFVWGLALHDLGKFAASFQKLYSNTHLYNPDKKTRLAPYDGKEFRHDRLAVWFFKAMQYELLPEVLNISETNLTKREIRQIFKTLKVLIQPVFGHHGQPVTFDNPSSMKRFTEKANLLAAQAYVSELTELLSPEFPIECFKNKEWCLRLEQVSWHLAGVAVLADWIGSDNNFFYYNSDPMLLSHYWQQALVIAEKALAATDLNKAPQVQTFKSVQEHYGFTPTPLQKWAEEVTIDDSPQLYILEDVTGAGKTEAALALTHRLMQAGAADGFYFGLPTMATSNAMFSRVAGHYQQMLGAKGEQPSIVLAHGAREMNREFKEAKIAFSHSISADDSYAASDKTATAQCNEWLADSRKKALLAPVGVGTIDQALLAVLPRRHQSLRLLGLIRKVLIFDEVHAADSYMFELLESLLAMHLRQGGSAILLSATMSNIQRKRLTRIWQETANLPVQLPQEKNFPLATKLSINAKEKLIEQPLASRKDVSRSVKVIFVYSFDNCVEKIVEAAKHTQCVVWVRNSVDDAIQAYQAVTKVLTAKNCLLFHSRFVLEDRKNIEHRVLEIFGKGSDKKIRAGKVLIATQVFQESLDADTDVMISDICPIDDLIQRAGRLHRHTRNINLAYEKNIKDMRLTPELILHAPKWSDNPKSDWLSKKFRNSQFVYRSAGRLWLGMKTLRELGAIRMPDEARKLIEAVYSDSAYEKIPTTLEYQENQLIGEERAKQNKAKISSLEWQYGYSDRSGAWYEDNTDISTRYSDIQTVQILLVKQTQNGELIPWIEAKEYAVPLSTIKLSQKKYANKLMAIPEELEGTAEQLRKKYKQAKYLQLWLAEDDPNYTYNKTMGFCDKEKQEEL